MISDLNLLITLNITKILYRIKQIYTNNIYKTNLYNYLYEHMKLIYMII